MGSVGDLETLFSRKDISYPQLRAFLLSTETGVAYLTNRLCQADYATVERGLEVLAYGFPHDRTEAGREFVSHAMPAVLDCLSSTNLAIRSRALWLVGDLGENAASAVDVLLRVAETPKRTEEERFVTRRAAIRSLGLIASESDRCLPVLKRLLEESDLEIRTFAVEAIGQFESEAAGLHGELESIATSGPAALSDAARKSLDQLSLPPRPREGGLAPDFAARHLSGPGHFALSEQRGSFVYLDFWSVSCPPCMEPLAACDALARSTQSDETLRRVRFVTVNLDPTSTPAQRLIESRGWTHALHVAGTDTISRRYRVRGIPDSLLIDPEGRILWRGNPHGMDLRRKLESLVRRGPAS